MRVLFTAHGAYGHVLPVLGMARALAGDGVAVAVATAGRFCELVAGQGLEAHPAGLDDDRLVEEARRRWPSTRSAPPAAWAVRMFSEIAAPAMAADLEPFVRRWDPDVVVCEEGEYGGPVAAAAARIPWMAHGWGSPLRPAAALAEVARLVAPLWQRAGLAAPAGDALYGHGVFDPCPPSLYGDNAPTAPRHAIRPVEGHGRTTALPAPSASDRPRAYLGFGTVPLFRDAPDLTRAAVAALVGAGYDVTVTTTDSSLAGDRVRVESWVELTQLLPRCALVVCHGGAGTVLASLAAGLPLLLLPRGAPSQVRMSAACEARGVAQVLWDNPTRATIAVAIADLTEARRFRAAAEAVAEELAAMPDPSTAAAVLRHTVAM